MTLMHDSDMELLPALAPLPPRYWWMVEVWLQHDSVHLSLMKGSWWRSVNPEKDSACAAVDFSEKSLNDIVHAINETSYRMSERYFRAAESPKVRLKADALAARLEQNPQPIKVVVKGPKR